MYEKVSVCIVKNGALCSLAVVNDAEIPWGSSKVYFKPDTWEKIKHLAEGEGADEGSLRFFDKCFHELTLLAPHNRITFVCEFVKVGLVNQMTLEEAEKRTADRTDDLTEVRERGGCCHRVELDNKPRFSDYVGPMWDGVRDNGTAVLRYESEEAYRLYSE